VRTIDATETARPAPAAARVPKSTPRRRKPFSRRLRVFVTIVNLSLFFIAWELVPVIFDIPKLFLPRLSEVVSELGEMYGEGILVKNVWISLRVYLTGMAIAVSASIPLGLLLGGIKILDRIISPYLWVIYTTPLIILMPLILLWVGINDTARVLLVVISAVPAIVVVVMEGVKTVDNSLLRAARSFGSDRARLFTRVVLPSTIPFIGTGVKMGVSRGLIGLFVGELFTRADGIGYLITLNTKVFNTAGTYALLAIFVMFSLAMVGASQYVERRLSVWRSQPIA
jgi:ABC-type nitrate/sulfonate/bicarbonate transport system permease component